MTMRLGRLAVCALLVAVQQATGQTSPGTGSAPQLAIDAQGTVRMIYGRGDTILAVSSTDHGQHFSTPVVVGIVPNMHLGNTRGPVLASSPRRTVVAAIGKAGVITLFELNHKSNRWRAVERALNDADSSAPEGLMTLAADGDDRFYAVWLDVREARRNQIYFATLEPGATSARANTRVYAAPNGPVCECCRPSVSVARGIVSVMFRNSLGGFRDMYVTTSRDAGKTFAQPEKLGQGTWKFDACPMDGGAMAYDGSGGIGTVWRRENAIYYARRGSAEVRIADGRSPMMAVEGGKTFVIWQSGPSIRMRTIEGGAETIVGEGRAPQVIGLGDGHVLTAWENARSVYIRRF
jgi:hypothetical protein